MLHLKENLQFKANIDFVTEKSPCFKSFAYPPDDNFVMSIDKDGAAISVYGDDTWNFKSFGAKDYMHFKKYNEASKALFKRLMFYIIYSHLFPGKYASLACWYDVFNAVFTVCNRYNLDAIDVNKFPKVLEEIAKSIPRSKFTTAVHYFHQCLQNKDAIGFSLFSENSIAYIKAYDPNYELGQNAYIPSRIWTNIIQNIHSALDEFNSHSKEIEEAYHWIAKSYISNNKNTTSPYKQTSPFNKSTGSDLIKYEGTFEDFLQDHNLLNWMRRNQKINGRRTQFSVLEFGNILNNVLYACYLLVIIYSLMRKTEALSLRVDALIVEQDERLGPFYLLVGETTKTDPDSDARWVVNKSAKKAFDIAKLLIEWKYQHIEDDNDTPYLFQRIDVWAPEGSKTSPRPMDPVNKVLRANNLFFKYESYQINQEDYDQALALTPSLSRKSWFQIGSTWEFGYHQCRRTLAVHFALNKISHRTGQFMMKHGTREQQFHYMNNSGRLCLNAAAEKEVINEFYAEMRRDIYSVVSSSDSAIPPYKKLPIKDDVICMISQNEIKILERAQKNGTVGYRKNLLGGCMKEGQCEFGGFDSITQCAAGEDGNFCSELIIDGTKEQEFKEDREHSRKEMSSAPSDSPRYNSLKAETQAYDNVLSVIKKKRGSNK